MKGHILYGVLNWGLGHATRSKPIIDQLLQHGFEVTLASDGEALEWLQGEFPQLSVLRLPGYKVRYARGRHQLPKLLSQLPRLAYVAQKENQLVARFYKRHGFTGLISDNRLGFFHAAVPSAYLTHQLQVPVRYGAAFARWAHQRYYQKFSALWIPDGPERTLSAGLSQAPISCKNKLQFTGNLSRFTRLTGTRTREIVAILSGPEPQRTLLDQAIRTAMQAWPGPRFHLVTGVENPTPSPQEAITVHGRLSSADLQKLLQRAQVVISRSGYSSIMDYAALGTKAVLIPTPGQGEQEFLAKTHQTKYAIGQQNTLNLKALCEEALRKPGRFLEPAPDNQWSKLFGLFEGKREG